MKSLKAILFSIFLISLTLISFAQAERHDFMVGGSMSYNSSKISWAADNFEHGEFSRDKSFNFNPTIGFFPVKRLGLGINFDYSYFSSVELEDGNDGNYNTTSYQIGPFLRCYIGSGIVKPIVHLNINTGNINYTEEGEDDIDENASITSFTLALGAGFFFNDHVSLDLKANYSYSEIKPKEENESNFKNLNNGIGFDIGFQIFL
ncbi:MAG: hypothetical protein A2X13_07770 [Bacteroidetes bacterium GWC2_33_15]|nr:MAG: hypothetical protein A2X10_04825 [Bacteroidetes bacterium GWA2_33_15]OFX52649.1 MAG: hypothetical protein A2X13_07770 [Bacteroidetes bacterium GWC2_33_15]OFX64045.1 MAG: hypothetical protein A2X15_02565 [Bacteroidetes bacterium GWB2_32_14]OFX67270.1 MAG: hypothetical protein A2X14_11850 [Bacteroidetes bacterium GWD2_33_33]HAN18871.1 hypothetical protein [Bacteroidales bacterium]